jgi:ubiquinone/menaquinone biosynthesis C-methylase UbiE
VTDEKKVDDEKPDRMTGRRVKSFNGTLTNHSKGGFGKVAAKIEKRDRHFPLFANDNVFRRLFSSPSAFCSYVTKGQVVADLGCGPGYYTLGLAECVGPEGKVYAVDSDEKAIRAVEKKAAKRGYNNIEAHASSASDLSFIKDRSVDFILANGLLCSMAPQYHEPAVSEMKRILKPSGLAYLSAAGGFYSYVSKAEWEKILEGFKVKQRGNPSFADRWAVVSTKQH